MEPFYHPPKISLPFSPFFFHLEFVSFWWGQLAHSKDNGLFRFPSCRGWLAGSLLACSPLLLALLFHPSLKPIRWLVLFTRASGVSLAQRLPETEANSIFSYIIKDFVARFYIHTFMYLHLISLSIFGLGLCFKKIVYKE